MTVNILSYTLSNIETLTINSILYSIVPLYLLMVLINQGSGWFTRRYSELFPVKYRNSEYLKFYKKLNFNTGNKIDTLSVERINVLYNKYLDNITQFLGGWNWGTSRSLFQTLLIFGFLLYKSVPIFFISLIGFTILSIISYFLSKDISKPIEINNKDNVNLKSWFTTLVLKYKSIKLINNGYEYCKDSLLNLSNKFIESNIEVRKYHSNRWLILFLIYNVIFIFIFFYCIILIMNGEIELGFILIIQYAFNNMFSMLIYFSEQYIGLIEEEKTTKLLNDEIYKKEITTTQTFDFIKCDKCGEETHFSLAIDNWCIINNESYCRD